MANKKTFEVAMILSASDKATRVINAAADSAKKKIASLSGLGDKAFSFGRGAGAAGLGIAAGLGLTIKAAEDSEIANRRLERTFRDMGEANDDAAHAAENYASKLQMQIGVEDEDIQMVQSKLATFKRVSDEGARASGVFNRATAAAYDLQAAGFGEASQNAVLLGKALQDPAKGATALARTGALNKSDIPLIKQIQATKGLGAAQQYVLERVEKQVKGQAATTATSAAKMKVTFAEVAETLGKNLLPQVQKTMKQIGDAANRFNEWAQKNKGLVGTAVSLIGKVALLSLGISALSFVFGGAVKAVQAAIWMKKTYILWTNGATLANAKEEIGRLRLNAVVWYTVAAEKAAAAGKYISATASGVATAAQWLFNASLYGCPVVWIVAAIIAIIAVVYLLVKNWDKVKNFFAKLWVDIKAIFWKAVDFIKQWGWLFVGPIGWIMKIWSKLPEWFGKLGGLIWSSLSDGLKKKISAVYDTVKAAGKGIANAFKSVLGIASPSKVFMDYGVNITEGASKGMQKGTPGTVAAAKGLGQGIAPKSGGGRSGGGMTVNIPITVNGGGGTEVASEIKKLVPEIIRQIESAWARKQRLSY